MEKRQKRLKLLPLFLLLFLIGCTPKKVENTEQNKETINTTTLTNSVNQEEPESDKYSSDLPKFAVVIDDFGNFHEGMLDSLLVRFCELPEEVAFAVLPNLNYSTRVMNYSFDRGHDILIHVPMQPHNKNVNPGEIYITPDDDQITILTTLAQFHEQLPKAIGINNHMGSRATEDYKTMETVMSWCLSSNLFFVDSATTPKTVGYSTAKELGVPTVKRAIFLDVPNPTSMTVDKYITKMEKYKKSNRNIVVITHCSSKERRDNLQYFIDECEALGYELVPITHLLEKSEKPI
ncbi:MAG: hypothetical protein B6226_02175 [Candidatus Cloacimonetes bacterium 4572_65]|nr:MAG: hypothetical protein B6226_02175 [Candidatus Cloacimonetes bacterium 4572_65]